MAISSIWTDPTGFSVDDASAAVSVSAALEAVGATFAAAGADPEGMGAVAEFAGAELSVGGSGMTGALVPASSPQREATTDLRAPASSVLARGALSGLIAPPTVASGRGAVKTLVPCSTRDCGNGNSARALAIEDGVLALFGGEAELSAGGEVSGAARAIFSAIFSLASPTYQQARLVARSTR